MNKHILETKLKSIKHYRDEIKRLQGAIEVNKSVLKDCEESLTEFFPFKKGDVIYGENRMYQIEEIKSSRSSESGDVYILVEVKKQSEQYGFNRTDTVNLTLDRWKTYKVIDSETKD